MQPESHISIDRDHLGRIGAMLEQLQQDRLALIKALGGCITALDKVGPSAEADEALALLKSMAAR